jgi:hypothetical protein
MSVMSAAEAGESAGTSSEIFRPGPRMAGSAAGQGETGPDACSEPSDLSASPRPDRRLRLVAEFQVTEVQVARHVRTRTLYADAPEAPARPAGSPRGSAPRPAAPRISPPRVSAERAGASAMSGERAGASAMSGERAGARRVSAQRADAERFSTHRVSMPGAGVQRVSVQRASSRRVSLQHSTVQPGRLRLTRRGRRILAGFAMLVAAISAMLIWTSVAGGAQTPARGVPPGSAYQGMTQIVVQPGQTLWSIATAAAPSANPWTTVQQISDANALDGAQVQAGQLLWVPRG